MKTCDCGQRSENTADKCEWCGKKFEEKKAERPKATVVSEETGLILKRLAALENSVKNNGAIAIYDLDLPFFRMVVLMVKAAIAAIPAAIIMFILTGLFWGFIGGMAPFLK